MLDTEASTAFSASAWSVRHLEENVQDLLGATAAGEWECMQALDTLCGRAQALIASAAQFSACWLQYPACRRIHTPVDVQQPLGLTVPFDAAPGALPPGANVSEASSSRRQPRSSGGAGQGEADKALEAERNQACLLLLMAACQAEGAKLTYEMVSGDELLSDALRAALCEYGYQGEGLGSTSAAQVEAEVRP